MLPQIGPFRTVPHKSVACGEKAQAKTQVICGRYTLPTVFSRARGWISACDKTVVCEWNRSTSERTNGRIAAYVTSTGASPSRAACSKALRTAVMNSDSLEGCIARLRSSPVPTIDSAKACSQRADSAISGR